MIDVSARNENWRQWKKSVLHHILMYFKANCKIPIDVTFVSLRTAALSAAGTCSIEATFTTDDFSREFSSAEHPGYSVQSRPGQQGRELPSTNTVWVVREVGDFAFPRVGVWESLVPVSAQSPPSSRYVFWVQCSSPLPGLSQTLPASMMILLTPHSLSTTEIHVSILLWSSWNQ